MWLRDQLSILLCCFLLSSCSLSRQAFDPEKKFPPEQLKEDYSLFRNILQDAHPSLYWYSTKDSVDHFFDECFDKIRDSMTEPQFRTLLSYVIAKINCGHTTVRYSKQYTRYLDIAKLKTFPLIVKLWKDSMIVTFNLNRRDSILKRGTVIISINGVPQQKIVDSLFQFLSSDGYNDVARYQQLSNRGSFGAWYRNVFGLSQNFDIGYLDAAGAVRFIRTPVYDPTTDTPLATIKKPVVSPTKKEINKQQLFAVRNLQVDTLLKTGYMTVNSFSRGSGLPSFYKRAFRLLNKRQISNIVIDVRSNGGGDASLSTLLTRYITDHSFKLADSLYTVRRTSKFGKYISKQWIYWVAMHFVTHKRSDRKYHFGYFERHFFKPKVKDHFNGHVYLLAGGNSFSATCLFAGILKGQKNVTIVGEETGGAAYGNTAWMIPEARLPNTMIRFRLPRFRLVMNKNAVKDGRGILPDCFAGPSSEAIRNGTDYKVEKVKELIITNSSLNTHK